MGDLPKYSTQYMINNRNIQVQVEVYKNTIGCYMAHLKYREIPRYEDKEIPLWKKAELVLNGPGKSKLEKKVVKLLRLMYEKPQLRMGVI